MTAHAANRNPRSWRHLFVSAILRLAELAKSRRSIYGQAEAGFTI